MLAPFICQIESDQVWLAWLIVSKFCNSVVQKIGRTTEGNMAWKEQKPEDGNHETSPDTLGLQNVCRARLRWLSLSSLFSPLSLSLPRREQCAHTQGIWKARWEWTSNELGQIKDLLPRWSRELTCSSLFGGNVIFFIRIPTHDVKCNLSID